MFTHPAKLITCNSNGLFLLVLLLFSSYVAKKQAHRPNYKFNKHCYRDWSIYFLAKFAEDWLKLKIRIMNGISFTI